MNKFRSFINRIYAFFDNIPFLRNPIWKAVFRSFLSLAIMMSLISLVYFTSIPNPNMILITGLVVCTAIFGWSGGIISTLMMIGYSMFFFSKNHSFFIFTPENLNKLIVIIVGATVSMLFVALFRRKARNERQELIKLSNIVYYDALTGVKNRYAFRKDIKEHLGKRIVLTIMDIDNFKNINDTYGHQKGDKILASFSDILLDMFGKEDTYRYGGDEFLIISEKDPKEFEESLKDLKQLLDTNQEFQIRFSAGYVSAFYKNENDIMKFIKEADKNMYTSKNKGKDCYTGSEL